MHCAWQIINVLCLPPLILNELAVVLFAIKAVVVTVCTFGMRSDPDDKSIQR